MKWLLCSVVLFFHAMAAFSQAGTPLFFPKNGHPDWLTVRTDVVLSAADVVRRHKGTLGLTAADEWVLVRREADALGMVHYRYQQYHRGVPVDGAELLIHERSGRVHTLNGKWVRGLDISNVQPALSDQEALQRALQAAPARRYLWESARAEALLKRIRKDARATFYPKPQLVIASPMLSLEAASLRLAWRVEIHAEEPAGRHEVYIDAHSGEVLDKANLLCTQNVPGIAKTRYSGERVIMTERMPDQRYRLFETTRGNGVETYNMQRGTNFDAAVDFTDDDNYWDNANIFKDDAATDAHWGAEVTYDYFLHLHDHAGLDNRDFPLLSFVHYGSAYDNAFWNGAWASYGDGSGPRGPFTSLDIVAHEFMHGITEFSARLRYRNESGALNEGFSDIFGAVVRFWAKPEGGSWLIGNEITPSGQPFRDMSWPKNQSHPATYKGQFWMTGSADNGGVHTNSGVKNYWFYLLSEGGSGVNDNGAAYDVQAIGMEAAAQIALRSLKYYLTALSTFADAREGAIQAAEDLFGTCSVPFVQVINAWYAVGVGEPLFDGDVQTTQVLAPAALSCGLTGQEPLVVQLRYWGCNADLQAGEAIALAYQVEDGPVVWDTLVLDAPLRYGDAVAFVFEEIPAVLAEPGLHPVRIWAVTGADANAANDTLTWVIESLPDVPDVRLKASQWPAFQCFLGQEPLSVRIGYFGCEPLPKGTELQVGYRLNEGEAEFSETIQTPYALATGDTFEHTFSQPADLSAPGRYAYDTWVRLSNDPLTENDTLFRLSIAHPPALSRSDVLTFEAAQASLDSVYLLPGSHSQIALSPQAARTGALGLRITGGDFDAERLQGKATPPRLETVWSTNPQFRSRLCLCADLTDMAAAELRFDLRQNFSFYYLRVLGQHAQFGSALRIIADGVPISNTFRANTPSADPWRNQSVNLKDVLGRPVELCFEALTCVSADLDTFTNSLGDRVLLDNITIVGQPVVSTSAADKIAWRAYLNPNPTTTWATLAIEGAPAGTCTLRLSNALGRIVRQQEAQVTAEGTALTLPIPLSDLPAGWYTLQVQCGPHAQTLRLLVQH